MPVMYDPKAFSPFRTFIYMSTARFFFGPLFFLQNRLEWEGRENIPDGPCVFVSNHLSNWDPPLVTRVVDRPVSYLAKKELYSDPFFKNLVLAYGAISIDRDKPEKSTFKAVKEMLSQGWNLGMFIEGTRSKTPGILGQPHIGPAYFAKANKLPLVPIGIIGSNVKNGKVIARIGKPVEQSPDLEETTWRTLKAIADLTGFEMPERTKQIEEKI
ncbi:MAG: 1-acyl-sn-glycerol-3-phosphate acyltransferase [Candidatus Obscuribacterales bacterium]|nr:1-acyl-sn-glycerol-3-phosphate acyltransferase [Candidatus Obscuribacterales bacterium]